MFKPQTETRLTVPAVIKLQSNDAPKLIPFRPKSPVIRPPKEKPHPSDDGHEGETTPIRSRAGATGAEELKAPLLTPLERFARGIKFATLPTASLPPAQPLQLGALDAGLMRIARGIKSQAATASSR